MPDSITERYYQVAQKIERACRESGRINSDINLIVVTKGHEAASIVEVVKAGATLLGENYPEETLRKISEINGEIDPAWHMIGHLQSRKIKLMYPNFECIHSIDSLDLAKKVNDYYQDKNAKIDILLEVNIAGEESKFGFDASSPSKREALLTTIEEISKYSHLRPIGLMTMPPYATTPMQNEACYNLCRSFCDEVRNKIGMEGFKQLSMGTSADFEMAIKCGATYVRVGEAIMGKRYYPNKE